MQVLHAIGINIKRGISPGLELGNNANHTQLLSRNQRLFGVLPTRHACIPSFSLYDHLSIADPDAVGTGIGH